MLNEHSSFILDMQKTIDIGITGFSFIVAYFIKRNLLPGSMSNLSNDPNYYIILLLIIIAWFISFKWMDMYMSYREQEFWQFFTTILKSCFMGIILVSITMYLLRIQGVSRLLMGIFLVLNVSLLTLSKFIIFKILEKVRTDGLNTKNILIVGSKERARQVIEVVEKHKATGYMVLGCFEVDEEKLGQSVFNEHKVIGLVKDLEEYLQNNIVDELIFAMSLKKLKNGDRYLAFAESMGIKVRIVPDWELHYLMYRPNIAAVNFEEFLGVHTMALQSTPQNEGKMLIKHVGDFLGAFILTIILLPVFIGIGLAIKIFSKGPIFYKQERLGMNGRVFMVYKFRTMIEHADEMLKELAEMNEADGPAFKIKDDPRIIPWVGTFLRKTSLDELPQLFNVLKSEMSLVGPRPPISKEVDEYSVWQRRRLSMKPGMTCLWQIAPRRNELSFEDWMKLDLQYIDNWSLFNDFKILVLTAKAVLTGAGR
ncbi:MAG: sugar transferase [Desulfobacula sp.]|jgi:exopolysaccharide biosynthesis polyprenyl glycosylphosphotransferase|uniref:sugar transferase n=1 Tax=Desulfobacula sp. TaxID=2593537 RepID=UPI001DB92153|nr:sugar transferase [Desulfobacula sp.]MBT3806671.1 sugar transferase [Desulfobacula sp.]MBT4505959.1 sugar transferase [Desulfobacula sp.]MBT5971009.1 sugar transferase [Desulfobacula sp.]MBT6341108.1 sugar transferase [Desulfobacula sp.]